MKVEEQEDILFLAEEGLKKSLPPDWKMCRNPDQEIFYMNEKTRLTQWEHPNDQLLREQVV